jgi:transcription elongation factor GreA
MNETAITRAGFEALSEELTRLAGDGRRAIAQRFREAAAAEAGADESADYLAVRDDQALLERRIALLEERLRSARIVEPELGNGRIDIGERVVLRDLETGERIELELVGPFETGQAGDRVSAAAPVGKAIHGRRRGEIAEVEAPRGTRRFEILAVDAPADAA